MPVFDPISGPVPPPYERSSYVERTTIRKEVKRMALNLSGRVRGAGGVVLNRLVGSPVRTAWSAADTTNRRPGNRARSDVQAREEASTQANPVATTHEA